MTEYEAPALEEVPQEDTSALEAARLAEYLLVKSILDLLKK